MLTSTFNHSRADKRANRLARLSTLAGGRVPVRIVNVDRPTMHLGTAGHYETRSGATIRHPHAYSKRGWSNMVYIASTERVEISYPAWRMWHDMKPSQAARYIRILTVDFGS